MAFYTPPPLPYVGDTASSREAYGAAVAVGEEFTHFLPDEPFQPFLIECVSHFLPLFYACREFPRL